MCENSSIVLSDDQSYLLNVIYDLYDRKCFDKFLVIKGEPGVGKSILIKAINRPKITLAFTNEAARNVDGSTLHSEFGIHVFNHAQGLTTPDEILRYVNSHSIVTTSVHPDHIYIIDESSMCPSYLFFAVWQLLKNQSLLIFFGDPQQAKPISDDGCNVYDFPQLGIHYELKTNYRFQPNYLTFVRNMIQHKSDVESLKLYIKEHFDEKVFSNNFQQIDLLDNNSTFICYTNKGVAEVAEKKYGHLPCITAIQGLEEDLLQIVMDETRNRYLPKIYINSDISYTRARGKKMGLEIKIMKQINDHKLLCVDNENNVICLKSDIYFFKSLHPLLKAKNIKKIIQFDLKFKNILTVHRVQGQTLKGHGYLNLKNCSSFNVFYTAFSRFPNFTNIKRILF